MVDDMIPELFQPHRPSAWRRIVARVNLWLWGRFEWFVLTLVIGLVALVTCSGCQQQKLVERNHIVQMEDAGRHVTDGRAKLAEVKPFVTDPVGQVILNDADAEFAAAEQEIAGAVKAAVKADASHQKQVKTMQKEIDKLSDPAVKWLGFAGAALIVVGVGLCISTYWLGRTMLRIGLLAIAMGAVAATLARFLPVVEWIVLGVLIVAAAFALWRWRAVYAAGVKVVQSIDHGRAVGVIGFGANAAAVLDEVQGPAGKELVDRAQGKRRVTKKPTISGSLRI